MKTSKRKRASSKKKGATANNAKRGKSGKKKKMTTPYSLLGVKKTASQSEIRKAYYRFALKCHPDKCKDESAKSQFQVLKKAYDLLSDPKRRNLYDRTGCTDSDSQAFWNAYEYYRNKFPAVTTADIDDFVKTYRNSTEERGDLVTFYNTHGGDVSNLLYWIPGSTDTDKDRFVQVYEDLIRQSVIKSTPEFERTKSKIKSCVDEAEEPEDADTCTSSDEAAAEEDSGENEVDAKASHASAADEGPAAELSGLDALRAQILGNKTRRAKSFESFADKWSEKTKSKTKKKKKKK